MKKLAILLFTISFAFAQYSLEKLLDTGSVIWGFDFVDRDRIIFTQREGSVYLFDTKQNTLEVVDGFSADVFHQGQGGLLDVAVAPDFKQSKRVYFTYAKAKGSQGATALAHATLDGSSLKDFNELIVTDSFARSGVHFGSRITFDSDGKLYFSVGDRGARDEAQNKNNHKGTILQVDTNDFSYTIYSYGHRNPQGMFYDSDTAILYSNEHGPRGGDEINIIKKGLNYGWPVVTLGTEYGSNRPIGLNHKEGMEDPIVDFTPSIAPSSLIIYKGGVFEELQGKLISTALAKQLVSIVDLENGEQRILQNYKERFRNVREDSRGDLYFSTDSGKIYRLKR